jgi:iron(III) transport system ATP-binding protein
VGLLDQGRGTNGGDVAHTIVVVVLIPRVLVVRIIATAEMGAEVEIAVRNLSKTFTSFGGKVEAIDGLSFNVKAGEFYTLLGPSGCGKSTTLRCVAGLERPDKGEITIGSQTVFSNDQFIPPNQRPIGMVFQSYAIWPHLTVFQNVAFPLKQLGVRRAEIRSRVMETLEIVEMASQADRPAPYLSGGQQQRVALARALVSKPAVLLLDEPLSNLDAKLREDLRVEIKELVQRLGITTLYVTHDQAEALAMSDNIAVLWRGQLLQEASPRDLYFKPSHTFVAEFIGQVNFFEGAVVENSGTGIGRVSTVHGEMSCTVPAGMSKGSQALIALRPENLRLVLAEGQAPLNAIRGRVSKNVFLGDFVDCQVAIQDKIVRAKLPPATNVSEGSDVFLTFDPQSCMVLPNAAVAINQLEAH